MYRKYSYMINETAKQSHCWDEFESTLVEAVYSVETGKVTAPYVYIILVRRAAVSSQSASSVFF